MASEPEISTTRMIEVARRAGVGIGSVSRVMSGHPSVSEEMRARVLAAVEELSYSLDPTGQALRRRRTSTIGFLVSDIANPFIARVLHGLEMGLRASDIAMVLANCGGNAKTAAFHLHWLLQRRVDGLILMPPAENDDEVKSLLEGTGIPMVFIDRDVPGRMVAASVLSDHSLGLGAAVTHLVMLGHRRIALIAGPDIRPARERIEAFTLFSSSKSGFDAHIVQVPLSPQAARAAFRGLMDSSNPPTAVIAGGNQLLEGVLREVQTAHMSVGRDISIISCDDTPLTSLYQPSISVIDRDATLLGATAAGALLHQISEGVEPSVTVLPTFYLRRASVASPGGR